jgi:hypothetical protein
MNAEEEASNRKLATIIMTYTYHHFVYMKKEMAFGVSGVTD